MNAAVAPPAAAPVATPTPRGAASGTNPAASANAEERIYTVAELPDDIRRSLPALPINGSTYSQNPASRMLIVNGQVFHEGDAITPELKLEQIRLKGAVLRFRNYRYSISY
jgi:general secretion pathway protein B